MLLLVEKGGPVLTPLLLSRIPHFLCEEAEGQPTPGWSGSVHLMLQTEGRRSAAEEVLLIRTLFHPSANANVSCFCNLSSNANLSCFNALPVKVPHTNTTNCFFLLLSAAAFRGRQSEPSNSI